VVEWHKKIEPTQKVTIEYEYEVSWEKGIIIHPPLP
jgi:hypothetical protein